MGSVRITNFGGIVPRTSERLLPDNAAQIAINCRLSSGELEPFNTGAKVYSSAKAGPLLAIHRIEDGGSYAWLAWAYDVDVVKTTLYGTGRWCYTGDGEPRITTVADAISGTGDDYPHTAYTLGTPKPVTAPTVNTSGGASATMVDRYYAYTFYAAWDTVEFEGAVSPISTLKNGKVDATWAITGMDASPESSGTGSVSMASGKTRVVSSTPTWLREGEGVVVDGIDATVTGIVSPTTFDANMCANLFTYTEQFDNAAWSKANCTITPDSVASPDASISADSLVESTDGSAQYHYVYQSITLETATQHTFSCYGKAGTRSLIAMQVNAGAYPVGYFNLSTGVVGTTNSVDSASIEAIGSGWYRCSITFTTTAATAAYLCAILAVNVDASTQYIGSGGVAVYLWGADIRKGPKLAYRNVAAAGSHTWARKAAFPGTFYKRLYRTTGTTGQWQLVADQQDGGVAWASATAYNDTLTDGQIPGDELITSTWEMPPVGLTGLFSLPSGSMGGWVGNRLHLSEPDQPHAWPPEYQMQADYPIVGAECFGSGVCLATTSWPYIIQGVDPGQMSGQSWKESLPCVSKRSVTSLGDTVVYASQSNMIGVSSGGASTWAIPYFTEREFKTLNPETMVSAMVERRLYVMYEIDGTHRAMIFNLNGDDQYLTEAHFDAVEIHGDMTNGHLYYAFGQDIYEFDPVDGYSLTQDWKSKEITLPAPQNLGAAKIVFVQAIDPAQAAAVAAEIAAIEAANAALIAAGSVHGAWNAAPYNTIAFNGSDLETPPDEPPANTVNFQLYAGGELKASRTVSDERIFRLPSGYKKDTVSVRVQSQCKIKSIELGQTPESLRQA